MTDRRFNFHAIKAPPMVPEHLRRLAEAQLGSLSVGITPAPKLPDLSNISPKCADADVSMSSWFGSSGSKNVARTRLAVASEKGLRLAAWLDEMRGHTAPLPSREAAHD